MTDSKCKNQRFYKEVNIIKRKSGFTIELDGRPVKTPLGKQLVLINKNLAEAVACEWSSQEELIFPEKMPMNGYANTAIDRIGTNRQRILEEVLNLAETDLLCYRTDKPKDLVSRQNKFWQPLLDWAEDTLEVKFEITVGVLPLKQPNEAIETLANLLNRMDDMELAGIASLTNLCGSIILALALAKGRIDVQQAFDYSQLDLIYQNECWGVDDETKIRQLGLKNDIESSALFLSLLS